MDDGELSTVGRLVSRIEADIIGDTVAVGSVLGTESELCARYGVSPTIFRQAARVLEAADLAVARRGNGGGLVVQGHSIVGAAKTIAIYLESAGVGISDMLPVSTRFFHLAISLACERMTLEVADRLRALLKGLSSMPVGFERGLGLTEVFQQINAASGNPIAALVMRVAQHFYTDAISFDGMTEAQFLIAETRTGELLEALIQCDRQRLPGLAEGWDAMHRKHMTLAARNAADDGLPLHFERSHRTLSEHIVHRILGDIRAQGWPVGARLGSEAELLERYRISRVTLRQAVRQLEQYFAVQSRRGPGGGVFVTAPSQTRVFGSAVSALQHAAEPHYIRGVLPDLVCLALDLAVRRNDRDPAALLQSLRAARDAAARDPRLCLDLAKQALAEQSGNKVVAFFLELLARMKEQGAGMDVSLVERRAVALLGETVDSLEAGDAMRAKRALWDLATQKSFDR